MNIHVDLKINTINTDLTSLTTVAQECLRTTEPKVNNHSESSVQTPTQRKESIELLTDSLGSICSLRQFGENGDTF